jgi:uncharacterized integral membrane protein
MKPKYIIATILIILFLVFVIQNVSSVTVSFLIFDITMPRALVLSLTFAIGLLVGIFLPFEFKKHK